MSYCSNCGLKLSDSSKFCADCGQPIDGNTSNQNEVQKVDEKEIEFGNMIIPPKSNENNKSYKNLLLFGIITVSVILLVTYGIKTKNANSNEHIDSVHDTEILIDSFKSALHDSTKSYQNN